LRVQFSAWGRATFSGTAPIVALVLLMRATTSIEPAPSYGAAGRPGIDDGASSEEIRPCAA